MRNAIETEEIVDLLRQMVSLPSHSGIDGQETKVAKLLHAYFVKNDIETHLVEVLDGRYNVIAKIPGRGTGKTLLLTGHTDTVPPYDMTAPYDLIEKDEMLYGRGAVDMKGAVACMAAAMVNIKRNEVELGGDLYFAGVIDEEHKSEGTRHLIEWFKQQGIKIDGAIVGEPSDGELCTGHRGLEWYEVEFIGKTVHGGKQSEGINAIELARRFMNRIEDELVPRLNQRSHPVLGKSTVNYGVIQGGTQPSTVAGECTLKLDRRWIPGETFESVTEELLAIIRQLEKEDPAFRAKLSIMPESYMSKDYVHAYMTIDASHALVKNMSDVIKEITGINAVHTKFLAWTDGGLLSTYAQIPTVVFGPGAMESAHSNNEHIPKSTLLPATQIYENIAKRFCINGRQ